MIQIMNKPSQTTKKRRPLTANSETKCSPCPSAPRRQRLNFECDLITTGRLEVSRHAVESKAVSSPVRPHEAPLIKAAK